MAYIILRLILYYDPEVEESGPDPNQLETKRTGERRWCKWCEKTAKQTHGRR